MGMTRRLTALAASAVLALGLAGTASPTNPAPATASSAPEAISSAAAAGPQIAIYPTSVEMPISENGPLATTDCEDLYQIACYQPSQIERAYDENPLFADGIQGQGVTIAIVDAFGSPTVRSDLHTFDTSFDLPDPRLQIISPAGRIPTFDGTDATMVAWASETTLDVEWAHALAPKARILLVETPTAQTEGLHGFRQIIKAENYVVDHHLASVISQSFGATEQTLPDVPWLEQYRSAYINAAWHGVTVLAAAGDNGATAPANDTGSLLYDHPVTAWPASDPLVTGVGGTELHLDSSGTRQSPDTVWNDGSTTKVDQEFFGNTGPDAFAGGGGTSVLFARPFYQDKVAAVVGADRGVPDVSMSAGCDGAVEIYESFPGVAAGWYLTCGTSESVPLFAGIVALADQAAGHNLGLINPALYRLAAVQAPGVVDVTSGDNSVSFTQNGGQVTVTGHAAGPGYDLASGVGTVDAAALIPELAGHECVIVGPHQLTSARRPACGRDWNRPPRGGHGGSPPRRGHGPTTTSTTTTSTTTTSTTTTSTTGTTVAPTTTTSTTTTTEPPSTTTTVATVPPTTAPPTTAPPSPVTTVTPVPTTVPWWWWNRWHHH